MFNKNMYSPGIWMLLLLIIGILVFIAACSSGSSVEPVAEAPTSEPQAATATSTSEPVATETAVPTHTPKPEATASGETASKPPIGDLAQYEHNLDCSPHNESLTLASFSILYPPEFEVSDCRNKPNNYVVFEHNPGTASEFIIFLSKMNVEPDTDGQFVSTYLVEANNLLDVQAPQIAEQLDVVLVNDQPFIFEDVPFHRRDFMGEVSGATRLVRVVTIPNFETGQGLSIMAMRMVEGDLEEGIAEFEALTQMMITSAAFTPMPMRDTLAETAISPDLVVQTVFDAAKSGDFGSLKDLCDPLGENDDDTQMICDIASDDTNQEAFVQYFAKGRINGTTQIAQRVIKRKCRSYLGRTEIVKKRWS
jgi:hypothetical protein